MASGNGGPQVSGIAVAGFARVDVTLLPLLNPALPSSRVCFRGLLLCRNRLAAELGKPCSRCTVELTCPLLGQHFGFAEDFAQSAPLVPQRVPQIPSAANTGFSKSFFERPMIAAARRFEVVPQRVPILRSSLGIPLSSSHAKSTSPTRSQYRTASS